MLEDMIARALSEVNKIKKGGAATLFFHNLARFDGIILLRHLALHLEQPYTIKPLVRNSRIYEILIHMKTGNPKKQQKLVLRIRDSCKLLPGSLADLAASFCPDAGGKGEIDHENVDVHKLGSHREEYLDYLDQDIVLLGLIVQKAQDIYWQRYKIDIVADMTISALAMSIFRMEFYDDVNCRIYIPNKNADTFVREGYYGGHADLYIPADDNLLYLYDVNSLYPFVMGSRDMPGGSPVWHSDLSKQKSGMDLKDMFGFIKAFVITPSKMDRPFLPYRMKDRTLLFPTGKFGGVYFSEELKYAETLGYKVYPISGFLFKRMDSPFKDFVHDLYQRRLEAKEKGDKAMAFIHKITMNSLYGRFGISPESTITKIGSLNEANKAVMEHDDFIEFSRLGVDKFGMEKYIYTYNERADDNDEWNPPYNSAVHISAAIAAYARIHMYRFISANDCYYTDTDSIVVKNPLPDEEVSSTEIGKFKLEMTIDKAIFLAPKAYCAFNRETNSDIIKQKGAGKAMVDREWFKSMLEDPDLERT